MGLFFTFPHTPTINTAQAATNNVDTNSVSTNNVSTNHTSVFGSIWNKTKSVGTAIGQKTKDTTLGAVHGAQNEYKTVTHLGDTNYFSTNVQNAALSATNTVTTPVLGGTNVSTNSVPSATPAAAPAAKTNSVAP